MFYRWLALLLGGMLLVFTLLGLIENHYDHLTACQRQESNVSALRQLAQEVDRPLPVPATGSLEYLNQLAVENIHRADALNLFLHQHPPVSCSR